MNTTHLEVQLINVIKEQKENVLIVKIQGSIEETTNFDKLIGPPTPEMHINCKEVSRINSVGVKTWIKYFSGAVAKGSKLRLTDCSSVIVEQINMISNFSCGAVVESIFVPFSCEKCHCELIGLFKTADLKKLNFNLPNLKCSKCGGTARFDDIPDEYFGFLMR